MTQAKDFLIRKQRKTVHKTVTKRQIEKRTKQSHGQREKRT